MKDSQSDKNILLVAGVGGHGEQMKRLRNKLIYQNVVVLGEKGLSWDNDKFYYVPRVMDYQSRSRSKALINFVLVVMVTLKVFLKHRPSLVVSTGPALAVPACIIARAFGAKILHIESWSRIRSISNTTKILRKLKLVDVVVYQYKDSILAGQERCEYWGHL